MRAILLLPDIPEIQNPLSACRKKFSNVPWVNAPEIAPDGSLEERAQKIAEHLSKLEYKKGYVLSGFPNTLEEATALNQALKKKMPKKLLPLALYWNGKPPKDKKDAVKEYRETIKPVADHYHAIRRLVDIKKPAKLKKGFKQARARSKKGRLIRLGAASVLLTALGAAAVVFLFFRDPIIKSGLIRNGQKVTGAKVEIEELNTRLSPLELNLKNGQAANAGSPMKNLVEFSRAEAGIDPAALTQGKIHITKLLLNDIRFNTGRKTSGALPEPLREEKEAPPPLPVEQETEDKKYSVEKVFDQLREFKPPDKDDLESTRALKELRKTAEEKRTLLLGKAKKLNIPSSVKEAGKRTNALRTIKLHTSIQKKTENRIATAKKKADTYQKQASAEISRIKTTLAELKKTKVSDIKDIAGARQVIAKGSKAAEKIKSVRTTIQNGKKEIGAAKKAVTNARKELNTEYTKAKKKLTSRVKHATAPLTRKGREIKALSTQAQKAAAELTAGARDLKKAVETDITTLKDKYSPEGLKASSEQMLRRMLGDSVVRLLKGGWWMYRKIEPYLPETEKKPKPKKTRLPGKTYSFPAPDRENVLPSLLVDLAELNGTMNIKGDPMKFSGQIKNLTSNMALTNKPVILSASGETKDKKKTAAMNLSFTSDRKIRGSLSVSGLAIKESKPTADGRIAGLMPTRISKSNVQVQVRDIVLGKKQFDALLEIRITNLQLAPPSGKGFNKEITAIIASMYNDLNELTILYGIGTKKTFRTKPDLAKLLSAKVEERVKARLAELRKKAESEIRKAGNANIAQAKSLGSDLKSTVQKQLAPASSSLASAKSRISKTRAAQDKQLLSRKKSTDKNLSSKLSSLSSTENSLNSSQNQLTTLKSQIEREKKRIQQEIIGKSIKKKTPDVKLPKLPKKIPGF